MKKDQSIEALRQRYEKLTRQLAKLGWILQGTITERTMIEDDPNAPGKQKAYGPYYQWTWKLHGKTVTRNLSRSQAKTYQKAIDNHRKMEKILREMRAVSLQVLEATTKGVKKRKPLKSNNLRLS